MDGTMIDSMPFHARSWEVFAQRHGVKMDLPELMRRTTGRTGTECMGELFGRVMSVAEALPLVQEKEQIYRDMFAPVFAEVRGFKAFEAAARDLGLKIAVGTAGDIHNVEFALSHLKLPQAPQAVIRGDMGLPGKPEPAIFLEAARAVSVRPNGAIVFEDAPLGIEAALRAGMRAVAICSTHSAAELAGDHVIAAVKNYEELIAQGFLQSLRIAD
ncbi:HAD family phosphatase [Variovorax sp. PCZ-1]|nr:HAD family phosphatase [Variovorax sp. PCZ-1]MBS7808543.1 HAD family phosphatase [Variovorax sp. PCZ-1]